MGTTITTIIIIFIVTTITVITNEIAHKLLRPSISLLQQHHAAS
jgi:hypothetical protein